VSDRQSFGTWRRPPPNVELGSGNFVIELVVRWDNDPTQIANTNRGAIEAYLRAKYAL
jgi:hypothetical protein